MEEGRRRRHYVEKGHRVATFAGVYVELLAVLGLVLVFAYLRDIVADRCAAPFAWRSG